MAGIRLANTPQTENAEETGVVIKAHAFGGRHVDNSEISRPLGQSEVEPLGYLEPPYDLRMLIAMVEISNALPQNIAAYVTNIDSYGFRLIPNIDLEADDVDEIVAQALWLDRASTALGDPLDTEDPTDEEIDALIKRLKRAQLLERQRLERFFDACCSDITFVELRKRTRQDLESTGNTWWEVLRDRQGRVARFKHISSHTMRLRKVHPDVVPVQELERVSPLRSRAVTVQRRFRSFVQVSASTSMAKTYFKGFRDPRIMGAVTGKFYKNQEELEESDMKDVAANEVIHFSIFSPRSPYGIPRWIGNQLSVRGSHEMEQVNASYFSTKAVPPLAILVSGGARMTPDSVTRLENFVNENIKGTENFWKILILQAEAGQLAEGTANTPKMELKPLTSATPDDATHQAYDQANRDKIGESFRNSPIVRGQSKDFNRSTAEAAVRLGEDQVYAPERLGFDGWMNKDVMEELHAKYHTFQSQTRAPRDPERQAKVAADFVRAGVLTPEDARRIAEDVFNMTLPRIKEEWVRRPIPLTLAGVQTSQVSPDQQRNQKRQLLSNSGLESTEVETILAAEQKAYEDSSDETKRRLDLISTYLLNSVVE